MALCPQCNTENPSEARFCQSCGRLLEPSPGTGPLPPNTVLHGRYRLIKKVAQGGMAFVYLAEDQQAPGQRWAVKEMRDDLLPLADRLPAIQSFQREADLLARLSHPALPRVADYFSEGGRHYLVMEYLEGETLHERLAKRKGRPCREDEVVSWAVQVCDVLEYLHSQQPPIIYRDIKPGNLMLDRQGRVRLIDFGIARYFDPSKKTDTLKMGTMGYAPPEQYQGGGQCDARSDVYALGATMYHLLTGQDPQDMAPFSFGQARPRKVNPRLSEWVDQVVMTALAYHPDDRFQSAADMRAVLQNPGRLIAAETRQMPAPRAQAAIATPVHQVVHIPPMEDLYRAVQAEAAAALAPLVAQEEEEAGRQRSARRALQERGTEAIRRQEWSAALEALDRARSEAADPAELLALACRAEEGHLAALYPQRAARPDPASAARDWESVSGAAAARNDSLAELFVAPRSFPAMEQALRQHRLLVLAGPSGCGKYCCALALAAALQQEQDGRTVQTVEEGAPTAEMLAGSNQVLIWRNPFGDSTFRPPALADRPDYLEGLLARGNYLILTTTRPLLDLALATTALSLWPPLAETILPLERTDYGDAEMAAILDRHAQQALQRGLITPRQRALVADPARRLELAPVLPTPLHARLFVEQALAGLDPHLPWSAADLQRVAAGLHGLRQGLARWFAAQDTATRLYLSTLLWLAGRPRREVWESYAAWTRRLQAYTPNLAAPPAGDLERALRFCLQEDPSRPRFRHPAYREALRPLAADQGREYLLEGLNEIERGVNAAAARAEPDDTVPVQAALLLAELALPDWDRVAPLLERLAAQPAPALQEAVAQGLAHAVQRRPGFWPTALSLLRGWAGRTEPALRLSACRAAQHLGRLAPAEVWPLLQLLAADALPAVRRAVVDVAAALSASSWDEAMELLRRLGGDAEEEVRAAVVGWLLYLARWRRRALLQTLAQWATGEDGALNGAIAQTLLFGQQVFSLPEAVPVLRRLLSRRDPAGDALVAFLSDPAQDNDWPIAMLTELARGPSAAVQGEMEHVLQATAWQQPEIVLRILDGWAHHSDRAIRRTALQLLASVGQAQLREFDPATGSRTLGTVYAEGWFRPLADLCRDPVMALRAELAYLSPQFAQLDGARTVELLGQLARDPLPRLRELAAIALAPFATRYADRIVPIMEGLVADEAVAVRQATIPALAEGIARTDVVPALTMLSTLVRDPALAHVATPAFIAVAVSRVSDATPVLSAQSRDTNPALRAAVLEVAAQTGRTHPLPTVAFLGPLTTDANPAVRYRLVEICRAIAQGDPQAPLGLLTGLVMDAQPNIRDQAMQALVEAGLRAPLPGLQALRELAQEGRSEVKFLVLQALAHFAANYPQETLAAVDPLVGDPDLTIRQATVPVIYAAGGRQAAPALERLGRLLNDPDERVAGAAQEPFLHLCAMKDPEALPVLAALVQERAPRTYMLALRGLDVYCESQPEAVRDALIPLVHHGVAEIRAATFPLLMHLSQVRLTEAVRLLAPLIEGPAPDGEALRVYWRMMRLPEGAPVVTLPQEVVKSVSRNRNWSSAEAGRALLLGEKTRFWGRRTFERITGKVK